MTTSCPPPLKCNTIAPGWLNGAHPKVTDGIVTREVCFGSDAGQCCVRGWEIKIKSEELQGILCVQTSQYTKSWRLSPLLRQ